MFAIDIVIYKKMSVGRIISFLLRTGFRGNHITPSVMDSFIF